MPWDPLHVLPDIAAFVALLLSVMAAFGFVQSFGATTEAARLRAWAALPWKAVPCSVQELGVAYRGTCRLDSDQERYEDQDFAECLGAPDNAPGQSLQDIIDSARFNSTQGLCGQVSTVKFQAVGGDSTFSLGRRLLMHFFHPRGPGEMVGSRWIPIAWRCHDSYLPWAVVRLDEGVRCAYAYGAPKASIYSRWKEVQDDLQDLGLAKGLVQGAECWRPQGDLCTVALKSNHYLLEREGGKEEVWRNVAIALAAASLTLAVCAGFFRRRTDHEPVPTEDPEEAESLSARVQRLVAGAAAKVSEATPQLSGRSSRRTVRAAWFDSGNGRPHQNLAADFADAAARARSHGAA